MSWAWWRNKKEPIVVGSTDTAHGELDKHSSTWRFVEDWANSQIKAIREKNDNTSLTEAQTAVLRGKIKAYRDLLALTKDRTGILTRD